MMPKSASFLPPQASKREVVSWSKPISARAQSKAEEIYVRAKRFVQGFETRREICCMEATRWVQVHPSRSIGLDHSTTRSDYVQLLLSNGGTLTALLPKHLSASRT